MAAASSALPTCAGNLAEPARNFAVGAASAAPEASAAAAPAERVYKTPPWRQPQAPAAPPKLQPPPLPRAPTPLPSPISEATPLPSPISEAPPPHDAGSAAAAAPAMAPEAPRTPPAAVETEAPSAPAAGLTTQAADVLEQLFDAVANTPDPLDLVMADPSDNVSDERMALLTKARGQHATITKTLLEFLETMQGVEDAAAAK